MKKNNYIYLICIIFTIWGCSKTTTKGVKEINIAFKENELLKLSTVSDNIDYSTLETDNKNFIGSIDKIIINGGKMYILDQKRMKIFVFTQNGQLLSTLNAKGRGPGEYSYIADFLVDPTNETIEVMDDGNAKIITYDFNFKFVNEREKLGFASVFSKFKNNLYIFYAQNYLNPDIFEKNESKNIIIMDKNNHAKNSYLPIKNKNLTLAAIQLTAYNDGFNIIPDMENTLYYVTENECIPKYKFNFDRFQIPDNLFTEVNKIDENDIGKISDAGMKIMKECNQRKYITNIQNVFESDNFLYFQYFRPGDPIYSGVLCKRSGHLRTGILSINFNLDETSTIFMRGDTLFTVKFPYELKNSIDEVEKKNPSENDKEIEKLLEFLYNNEANENPILIKMSLKDF